MLWGSSLGCKTPFFIDINQTYYEIPRHYTTVGTTNVQKFGCKACGSLFENKNVLKIHTSRKCKGKPFRCNDCNYSCQKKKTLTKHITQQHKIIKPYKCSKCKKGFKSENDLENHFLHVHSKGFFKCDNCNISFTKEDFENHNKIRHPVLNKCDRCKKVFESKSKLKSHIQEVHLLFKCLYCEDVSFEYQVELEFHNKNVKHRVQNWNLHG